MNYTYILKCKDDSLYTGWTNDLKKRITSHNAGKGAKYTKARKTGGTGLLMKEFQTREEAMKREYAIKQLSRKRKRGTDQDQASLKGFYIKIGKILAKVSL